MCDLIRRSREISPSIACHLTAKSESVVVHFHGRKPCLALFSFQTREHIVVVCVGALFKCAVQVSLSVEPLNKKKEKIKKTRTIERHLAEKTLRIIIYRFVVKEPSRLVACYSLALSPKGLVVLFGNNNNKTRQ